MLLHIRPRFLSLHASEAELVDLQVEPFGLYLRGGVDLITGRVYPNRLYWAACRKTARRKFHVGILIETPGKVEAFSFTARWAIAADEVVTHHVHYRLLDAEHDAASDDTEFWCGNLEERGGWSSRWPVGMEPVAGNEIEPLMEFIDYPDKRPGDDRLDGRFIVERRQAMAMPTIERKRLLTMPTNMGERMPPIDSAFQVQV